MDWVVKSVTRPARRSRSRLQMWCLEQGSSPAVGSSKSNTCKGQRDQSSSSPSCVYLAQFHACITSFHAFDDLTQRRKCILKYWLFLLLFLLLQYYHPLIKNIVLIEPDSPILPASELMGQEPWNGRGKSQQSLCQVNTQSYAPKLYALCVHEHNRSPPEDSLKSQFQETIFVFAPHSGHQHKHSERR